MDNTVNVLKELFVYFVSTFGVASFSYWLLKNIDAVPGSWFEKLEYGRKRLVAVVVAALGVTLVWLIGVLVFGYFSKPDNTFQAWIEAWAAITLSTGTIQQIIQGFAKEKELAEV